MNIPIKLLTDNARPPQFSHQGDVCADLHASEKVKIPPAQHRLVGCGFAMALPKGYEAQIRPRSGLAAKNGITVLNTPGTIDSGYRGEVKVILYNTSREEFTVIIGDRIAQMAIREVPSASFFEVSELSDTIRGTDGFGSTGVSAD